MNAMTRLIHDMGRSPLCNPATVLSASRLNCDVVVRQAACFVGRRKMKMSYPEIGRQIGRDHSSVINGVERFLILLQRRDALAIRAYKLAIRAHVRIKQADAAQVAVLAALAKRHLPPTVAELTREQKAARRREAIRARERDRYGHLLPFERAA